MLPRPDIDLSELVNEARERVLRSEKERIGRQIGYIVGELSELGRRIEERNKDNEVTRARMAKLQEKLASITSGDWSALEDSDE